MRKANGTWKLISVNLALMFILGSGAGCGAGQSGQKTYLSMGQAPIEKESVQTEPFIFVDELLKNASSMADQMVIVKGKFMGWQGNCDFSPPETRSDWMLTHNGRCIYVSGPVPMNLSRERDSSGIGQDIEVRGQIRFDKEKRPYLKANP